MIKALVESTPGMSRRAAGPGRNVALGGALATALLVNLALAQTPAPGQAPAASSSTPQSSHASSTAKAAKAAKVTDAAAVAKSRGTPTRYLPDRFAGRAGRYYSFVWGIDQLSVKWVESGEMIRFTWRVIDAPRAQVLNDKKAEPSLIDPQRGIGLVVPAVENIGQLRQTSTPETGRSYWIAFSNKGRLVKRGDRVNVVVGTFRADGLVVD